MIKIIDGDGKPAQRVGWGVTVFAVMIHEGELGSVFEVGADDTIREIRNDLTAVIEEA